MPRSPHLALSFLALAGALLACEPPAKAVDLVFIDGRAVVPVGDTLLAFTEAGLEGFVVRDERTQRVDTLAAGLLNSPHHIEYRGGHWYVSDVTDGQASIVELTAQGALVRRLDVSALASAPHQFGVLPDGRIVVENRSGELVALSDSGPTTFAVVDRDNQPGLLIGTQGGVLYTAPRRFVTLYNAHGNIRWRLSWPWNQAAFIADMAVDAHGRLHLLAGQEGRPGFVVFSLATTNGEVVRWSELGPYATFVVDRMGTIEADSAETWLR